MYKYLALILSVFLALSGFSPSDAQTKRKVDWDKILDQYEEVCDRCMLLRNDALEGKRVSSRRLKSLNEELDRLKQILGESGGSMTDLQVKRFQQIRQRYEGKDAEEASVPVQEAAPVQETAPVPVQAASTQRETPKAQKSTIKVEEAKPIERVFTELPDVDLKPATVQSEKDEGISLTANQPMTIQQDIEHKSSPMQNWIVMLNSAVFPDLSAGASLHYTAGSSSFGIYCKARSNFKSFDPSYSCNSDGSTPSGTIWTSGEEIRVRHSLSIGASYHFSPMIAIYAGGGYGLFHTGWEDHIGNWAKVEDLSTSGIQAETGILLRFDRFALSMGVSTTAFRYSDIEIGVGFAF